MLTRINHRVILGVLILGSPSMGGLAATVERIGVVLWISAFNDRPSDLAEFVARGVETSAFLPVRHQKASIG